MSKFAIIRMSVKEWGIDHSLLDLENSLEYLIDLHS